MQLAACMFDAMTVFLQLFSQLCVQKLADLFSRAAGRIFTSR